MSSMIPRSSVTENQLEALTFYMPIGFPPLMYSSPGLFGKKEKKCFCYDIHDDNEGKKVVAIPLSAAEQMELPIPRPLLKKEGVIRGPYEFQNNLVVLKPNQVSALNKCLKQFEHTGSVILCANTGFGKTVTACTLATNPSWLPSLSSEDKKGVIIVTHRTILKQQWINTLKQKFHTTPEISLTEFLSSSSSHPILITSPIKLTNELAAHISKKKWIDVKLCIVDEVHAIMNETGVCALLKINCDFSIGLSATPYRLDSRDICLTNFYGGNMVNVKMERTPEAIKEVYVWKTGQQPPPLKIRGSNKVTWNDIMDWQCFKRCGMDGLYRAVAEIHKTILLPGKTILFLTKRVCHAATATQAFTSHGLTVSNLCEKTKKTKKNTTNSEQPVDVIVATYLKAGEGFDVGSICGIVLACDMNARFIQVLGRIRCFNNPFNFVLEVLDNSPQLKKHFNSRLSIYRDCEYQIQEPMFNSLKAILSHIKRKHERIP